MKIARIFNSLISASNNIKTLHIQTVRSNYQIRVLRSEINLQPCRWQSHRYLGRYVLLSSYLFLTFLLGYGILWCFNANSAVLMLIYRQRVRCRNMLTTSISRYILQRIFANTYSVLQFIETFFKQRPYNYESFNLTIPIKLTIWSLNKYLSNIDPL